jgi:hypothetical protein
MFFEIILSVDEIKMKLCEKILLNVKFMINSHKQSNSTNVGIILNSFENLLKVRRRKKIVKIKFFFFFIQDQ